MKAIRLHEPIDVEGLVYENAPDPKPALGQTVVIHDAGGAVGSVAVQLARAAGGKIILQP